MDFWTIVLAVVVGNIASAFLRAVTAMVVERLVKAEVEKKVTSG